MSCCLWADLNPAAGRPSAGGRQRRARKTWTREASRRNRRPTAATEATAAGTGSRNRGHDFRYRLPLRDVPSVDAAQPLGQDRLSPTFRPRGAIVHSPSPDRHLSGVGIGRPGRGRSERVSHAAPYHHFATAGHLVAAIVAEGYDLLRMAMEAALPGDDPLDDLRRIGVAYVDFALGNPSRYRLMFRPELIESAASDQAAIQAGAEAYAVLTSAVQRARDAGALQPDLDIGVATLAAWSAVHGLASLVLDGAVGVRAHERERAHALAQGIVGVAIRGLSA